MRILATISISIIALITATAGANSIQQNAPYLESILKANPQITRVALVGCTHNGNSEIMAHLLPKHGTVYTIDYNDSIEAAHAPTISPQLVYINPDNDVELMYHNLEAWYARIQGQGMLCGSDHWRYPVSLALHTFAVKNNLGLLIDTNRHFWVLSEQIHSIPDLLRTRSYP